LGRTLSSWSSADTSQQNFLSLFTEASTSIGNLVHGLARAHSTAVTSIANTIVDQQIKVVYRILSSDRVPQVVSAIQLLAQLVTSGGTSIADMLYRLVVSDFNVWPKLLSRKGSMREKEISKAAKTRKFSHTAGVRPHAIEFLIALIENASPTSKESVLTNRLFMGPIVKFLPLDSNATVCNLIRCLYAHVLLDKNLPRKVKSTVFNTENMLFKIISVHGQDDGSHEDRVVRDNLISQFLLEACTTYGNGVCFHNRGWYPPPLQGDQDVGFQFYNGSLLRFITQLRPLDIAFHRDILMAVLHKCADLRGPYLQSISSPARPDLSFLFISQAGLLQEIISLPLPSPFTTDSSLPDIPPPTKIVVENLIMPPAANENFLVAGRGHESRLIRYTSSQLLYAILTKLKELQDAIRMGGEPWYGFLEEVFSMVHKRLPEPSSLLRAYSQSSSSPLLAVCCLKVLLLYGEVFTDGDQKFDLKTLGATLQSEWSIATTIDLLDRVLLLKLTEQNDKIIWWTRKSTTCVYGRLLTSRRRQNTSWSSARETHINPVGLCSATTGCGSGEVAGQDRRFPIRDNCTADKSIIPCTRLSKRR
jgi:hypothetical protein